MNRKIHQACTYGGLVFVVLFGIGWALIAGFVPPPPPTTPAADIAAFYADHRFIIIAGMFVVMVGVGCLMPFMASVSVQLARIEGRWPVLAVSQVTIGVINTVLLLIPVVMWTALAFRPDRDPTLIELLNDTAWMFMLWPFSTASVQNIIVGACILTDKSSAPVYPRWFGYFNLWTSILLAGGGIMPFFMHGPFAWNGLFGFWTPAVTYLFWISMLMYFTLRAINAQAQDEAQSQERDGAGNVTATKVATSTC